ncbi:MAG: MarR family transcriptional regulator [Chitinophaga sp.]|uniref:MarR family winged helix-turn-helix transcriptional regulator n=1 Tax=Chitinophaga sp. TaxID=1869181 RepID=UPI001B0E5495|nr:MarR family transcriptional regulator [Chitinophaga sp.]MBO9731365.1 MarR family transcriptional regulator [Chitinophaga sp.]
MPNTADQLEQAYTNLQCLIIAQVNRFSTEKLTATQYLLLDYLIRCGASTTGQLAKQFHISAPAVSRHIKKLVQDGLIVQERDLEDRRSAFNDATPKGVKLVNEAKKLRKNMTRQLQQILSERDQATFIRLCNLIKTYLHPDE